VIDWCNPCADGRSTHDVPDPSSPGFGIVPSAENNQVRPPKTCWLPNPSTQGGEQKIDTEQFERGSFEKGKKIFLTYGKVDVLTC
jgi:hypothetical protein